MSIKLHLNGRLSNVYRLIILHIIFLKLQLKFKLVKLITHFSDLFLRINNRNQAKKSILILSKNTPINMDHLHLINPIMILADRSNSNESIVKWEKEFQKANIAFYAAKKKPLWIELE